MKKDQIDRDIKVGKLSSKEFHLDTFRAVIVLSWLFVLTVAAVAIVVWDWLHSKQPVTEISIVGILVGVFFMAQLLSFFREDRLTSIETGLDSEQNRQLIRQYIHKKTFSVRVLDQDAAALPGASIQMTHQGKVTGRAVNTSGEGLFPLADYDSLQVSFIGYKELMVKLADKTINAITVQLALDDLQEAVKFKNEKW